MKYTEIKNHRLTRRIIALFNQGLTPRELSLSITLGVLIGVLPLFGIATPLITGLSIWLRLNLPLAVFMTYAVSPIHLLLFIPFIRVGEWLYGVQHSILTFASIKNAFVHDYVAALQDLIFHLCCGLTGWVVIGFPVTIGLFYAIYLAMRWIRRS